MDTNFIANFITDWSGIDTSNYWALIPQVLSIIPLLWFSFKSIKVIAQEIKSEHNTQGAIPILAFFYMCFAIIYSIIFIRNFGEIINFNDYQIRMLLTDENPNIYVSAIRLLTCFTLIAFIFNFYKSFLTLNSLEFGKLNNLSLKKLFNSDGKKAIVEVSLRFFIALLFIVLEKKLAFEHGALNVPLNNNAIHFDENDFLYFLGVHTTLLYLFIIIWTLIFNLWLDKKKENNNPNSRNTIPSRWYKLSFWQFGFGLFIGITLIALGQFPQVDSQIALFGLSAVLFISGISSIGVVVTIVINEFTKWDINGTPAIS